MAIEAHDEISWGSPSLQIMDLFTLNAMVVWIRLSLSMRVVLHTKKGLVPAVFGWPAIHT